MAEEDSSAHLTGRRRYIAMHGAFMGHAAPLALQVEVSVFNNSGGKQGWETLWRFARADDIISETVI